MSLGISTTISPIASSVFCSATAQNDGFHEAIGDAIALSITPEYLKKIGLIEQIRRALDKIPFLPFGLLVDKWRWQVFSGEVKPADYNKAWWRLREKYQGVCAAGGPQRKLNRCSAYGSQEAGRKFRAMLQLGQSKPWPEALKQLTGEDRLDASAIVEYFRPLRIG